LLVVLVLFGVMAGMVGLQLAQGEGDQVRVEAQRLATLLDHAAAEARLTGRGIAWTAEPARYRFLRWSEEGGWRETTGQDALRAHDLPAGVTIESVHIAAQPPQSALRLEFSADGLARPAQIALTQGLVRYALEVSPVGLTRVGSNQDLPGDRAAPQ
jgi:general secretion pathway protein H